MAEKTYDVTELFGSDVFNEAVMKARLPKAIFKELMKVMHGNAELTLPIAEELLDRFFNYGYLYVSFINAEFLDF